MDIICFAKSRLTEDLCIAQKEWFSITCYMCETYTRRRRSLFIREKPILSLGGMLHKKYDNKGSVAKINLWSWVSRGLVPRRTDWLYTTSRKVTLTLILNLTKLHIWASSGSRQPERIWAVEHRSWGIYIVGTVTWQRLLKTKWEVLACATAIY
jgi:hypothetical protein